MEDVYKEVACFPFSRYMSLELDLVVSLLSLKRDLLFRT
jgi:hypothetical protein